MTESTTVPMSEPMLRGSKRGMLARIPFLGDIGALGRFFKDADASIWGKAFVIAAFIYVIMPIDAIPDVAPVIGWLDDLGVMMVAFAYLTRVIGKYRQ